jgi:hypothetical protein
MAELERDLRLLAAAIDVPAEPDLARTVRARIAQPERRRIAWRPLAVALAILVVAVGVAFAVPQARSAILRFLGLENVTVVEVRELPPATRGPGAIGDRVSLAQAERRLGFEPLLPKLGRPDTVYLDPAAELLVVLYGRPVRIRLSEFKATYSLEKLVTSEQQVQRVRVDGNPGLWIQGPHVVSELFGQPRLSGNALIWQRDGLTLRLEGRLSRADASRLARSIR